MMARGGVGNWMGSIAAAAEILDGSHKYQRSGSEAAG